MDDPLRSVGSDKGPDDNPHFTNDPEDKHNGKLFLAFFNLTELIMLYTTLTLVVAF